MSLILVKLAPEVELVAVPVADAGGLVLVVGALVGAPDLGVVGEGEGAAPLVVVGHDAAGQVAVDEEVLVLGRGDLDLLGRIGGAPLPDLAPVVRLADGRARLVHDVDLVLLRAVGAAEAVGGWEGVRPDRIGGVLAAGIYGSRALRCEWHSCNSGSQKALDNDVLEDRHFGEW
ncbi:hypothetical protein PG985_008588 [Apiospora marii]|uniref:uncharacterized protein n=1 Tax=Apiospora marii TaxID=335849 RepID=UPI00312FBBB9